MKNCSCLLLFILIPVLIFSQPDFERKGLKKTGSQLSAELPGFLRSIYYDEQVRLFESPAWAPEVKFHINAPSAQTFDPGKKVLLILYTLPNGNSTDHTIGNVSLVSSDWHYDIQHIGAQTRFLRSKIIDYNVVVVYLESNQKSWPTWRGKHPDSMIKTIVDSLKNIFVKYDTRVVISGHSGGGSFMFGFLNACAEIPSYVDRIAFLDATYNFDENTSHHGTKLTNWLKSSSEKYLSVLAYNDSVALYNGEPVVSPTGGTWYRSKMMIQHLKNEFTFTESIDSVLWKYSALNGRISFILKTNPSRLILHTVQVEMNGFIQSILSGTPLEENGYVYYTAGRGYSSLIQYGLTLLNAQIPSRPPNAMTGSQFMNSIINMNFTQREPLILAEIKSGNIPNFYRNFKEVQINYGGHICKFLVMPDYLAIGSDEDYCRVPMGPKIAQEIADYFGCTMPTPLMVDSIWKAAGVKLSPVSHAPVGDANERVSMFITHNQEIEQQRLASGKPLGEIVAGIKKDVVITNLLIAAPTKVAIYGWHYLTGIPIQPLTTIHISTYVDYSHGIRLINSLANLDGSQIYISQILKDANLYKILSNETGAMAQPYYNFTNTVIQGTKNFGVVPSGKNQLKIILPVDASSQKIYAFIGKDGVNFTDSIEISPQNNVINNLKEDSIYYICLKTLDGTTFSLPSETLSAAPTDVNPKILIVNGFDRASSGNTKNFVRQHGISIKYNGHNFASCTNDAVVNGLIELKDYDFVDWILGDESTGDETFSTTEQNIVKEYLKSGGKLFVSGCELAWDLDYKGSASDKDFCYNYLKLKYLSDAPYNKSGTYYQIQGIPGTKFGNIPVTDFDNGKQGTINVLWPDAIKAVNGGVETVQYYNVDTTQGVAGIYFDGIFPNGSKAGKLVAFGIPFETIYPESNRRIIMSEIPKFSGFTINNIQDRGENKTQFKFELKQNYPNPFNPLTKIDYSLGIPGRATIKIYNLLGELVTNLVDKYHHTGNYSVNFCGDNLSSGTYFYVLKTSNHVSSKKMLLIR